MSTVMKHHMGVNSPTEKPVGDKQLRHDRITAVVVLVIVTALMALVVWLASLGGSAPSGVDYWQMMP